MSETTFFVKHEALHSSTESEVNTEAWEPKKLENLKEADWGLPEVRNGGGITFFRDT